MTRTKEAARPKLARWDVDDLKLADYNPRRISKARFEDLKRSMKADPDFLEVRPIIVNVRKGRRGNVIGGHMRLLAARDLGYQTVPVVEVDVDERTEKAWNLKDNSHHGEWDRTAMAEMVMPDPVAFEHAIPTDMLDDILNEFGPDQEGEKTPEDQADAIAAAKEHETIPGDLWELGDHRLLCGDSTDAEAFKRLLGGEDAGMCFTDPPYNVDYGGKDHGNKRWSTKHKKIANDKMEAGEWARFVKAFLENIRANVDGAVYICMSCKEWPTIHAAFLGSGFKWSDTIIWIKDVFTLGRSDHQHQHEPIMKGRPLKTAPAEPILYGWPANIDRKWNGGRDEADAWFFKRPKTSPIHPTQKPVELVARAITSSSNRGDTVLDCFAGGGVYPHRVREDRTERQADRARSRLL